MTTHLISTGTGGTPGTALKQNGKPCPGTENGTGTGGTITADYLAARVAALAVRMRAGPAPGASVPAVPASESSPGQTNARNINAVPPAPTVPAQNGKADLSRAVPTTGQDRPSEWWNPSGPLSATPPRRAAREHDGWRDYFEERAAIREHDGGMSRADAEAGAIADCVARWRALNPLSASGDGACVQCGKTGPDTPVLARDGHAWLHRECWGPMNTLRSEMAFTAVRALLGDVP